MSLATHIDSALQGLPCFAFGRRYRDPPRAPSIFAIGSSWFFYPLTAGAGTRIVLHDYDNALPSGKPFCIGTSAWFKPVFDAVHVPESLQRNCLVHILDLFTASLERIVVQRRGRVVLVHSRCTLSAGEWADELHPTAAGFRKLAAQAWLPVLRAVGIA